MNIVATERPRLLVIAGPNGTGKTTLTDAGLRHAWFAGCEYINPDVIAQQLGDWNNVQNVLEAAQIATEHREACLREGRSLAFETVFSSPEKTDFVSRAMNAGFFIRLFFIGTATPEINAARVARRILQGGHDVPLRKIIERWSRSIANCEKVARFIDRFYLYDNSVDDREPQLILRAAKGKIVKWYDSDYPAWASQIISSLERDYMDRFDAFDAHDSIPD